MSHLPPGPLSFSFSVLHSPHLSHFQTLEAPDLFSSVFMYMLAYFMQTHHFLKYLDAYGPRWIALAQICSLYSRFVYQLPIVLLYLRSTSPSCSTCPKQSMLPAPHPSSPPSFGSFLGLYPHQEILPPRTQLLIQVLTQTVLELSLTPSRLISRSGHKQIFKINSSLLHCGYPNPNSLPSIL